MAATTFTATTADGSTVVRTSSTREYTFVLLGTKDGQPEGAISWHGDKANADKAATTWSGRGVTTRVVPVEQVLRGKAARAAIEAAKAGTVFAPECKTPPVAAPSEPVVAGKAAAGPTTRRTKARAATASTPGPAEELAGLAAAVTAAEAALADARARRDSMIAAVIAEKLLSGPAVGKIVGLTPMATYNAAKRAK